MPVTPNTTFHAPNNCDQQIFSFKQFHNSFHQLIFVEWECMYVIKLIHVESAWSRDGFECIGLRAYGCSVEPTNRPTGAMSTTHSQHNTIRFARMCQTLTSLPMQDDALLRAVPIVLCLWCVCRRHMHEPSNIRDGHFHSLAKNIIRTLPTYIYIFVSFTPFVSFIRLLLFCRSFIFLPKAK